MLEALSSFITDYGYLNLFVLSFLASTVLPLGSEALVVALIYQGFNPFAVVLVATSGNYLGSCTTYYLGLKGRPVLEKFLSPSPEKLEISERLFKKNMVFTPFFLPGCQVSETRLPWLQDLCSSLSDIFLFWFFLENSGVILLLLI